MAPARTPGRAVFRVIPGGALATPSAALALLLLAAVPMPALAQRSPAAAAPSSTVAAEAPAPAATGMPVPRARGAAGTVDAADPGAVLYHNYCSVCHGDRGDGRSRATGALSTLPRDFTSAASRRELDRERIVRAVTFGRPGTAMVGWTRQLSAADIERVADHVLQRFVRGNPLATSSQAGQAGPTGPMSLPRPAPGISGSQAHGGREADGASAAAAAPLPSWAGAAATPPGATTAFGPAQRRAVLEPVPASALDATLALPLGLVGQVGRGEAFYRANCATCHGLKGDGQGPRAYFINPPPRNFVDPATRARFNRPLLYATIHAGRPGTEMPAWSKVMSDQQMADVAEYVFQRFVLGSAPGGAR